jgi:hypothetical protein
MDGVKNISFIGGNLAEILVETASIQRFIDTAKAVGFHLPVGSKYPEKVFE